MSRSLQRHLSLMLGGAILISALVAAAASFVLAYDEARELQDDMLRQIAVLNARGMPGSTPDGGAGDVPIHDRESRFLVFRLPTSSRPNWLSVDLAPGFHTLDGYGEQLRVFVRDAASGTRSVVAQPTDIRDEIAVNSALRTMVPLLLLLPLLAWLILRIVRHEFAPVARLSRNLDEQAANRPGPINDQGIPDEITPFVHAINRLLERVNHLMAQQMRFIADAAHELRSPLTALSVQAQNLQHAQSPEAMHARILPLQAGIERAQRLTDQLLSLARTGMGKTDEESVDVAAIARELIAEFLPKAEAKRIELELEEHTRLLLRTSAESLRLILGNALDNAVKYTPAGGSITLRLSADGEEAVVEVVDNGPGIPPDERGRVFDAFYRIPGSDGTGSGLGLAIAREAALRTGGRILLSQRNDAPGLVFSYRQRRLA